MSSIDGAILDFKRLDTLASGDTTLHRLDPRAKVIVTALFIMAVHPSPRYPKAPEMEPFALLNPELLWASEETELGWEGCLSIPGLRGLVPRSRRIGVRYLTRRGELREEEYTDFLARVFQHEFDHVQGMVFIDRVESTRELATEKEYLRMLQSRV